MISALHVGFSKCGSTFLQSYFSQIEQIDYIEKSRFFSPVLENYNNFEKGLKYYNSLFKNPSNKDIRLESDEHIILPDYHPVLKSRGTTLNSVDIVIDRISRYDPHTKIILVIRNQYDLIISRYSQYVVSGGTFPITKFLNEFVSGSTDGNNYFENYYYIIINKLYDAFGKDNILVVLQERLRNRQDETLKALNKFLDLKKNNVHQGNILNQRKGLSLSALNLLRKFNKAFVIEKESISEPIKTIVPSFFYINLIIRGIRFFDFYLPKSWTKSKQSLLTNNLKNNLSEIFSDDNKKLETLFNIQLSKFGYI